jgi:hypothetical protein
MLSHAQLKEVPLSPTYNISLFAVQGVQSLQNTVFVLPKPLTEGATWSDGRVRSTPQPGGSFRLSFSVLTINPKDTFTFVTDPGFTGQAIPEELQIHNARDFEEELKRRGLKLASPSTLSGCPTGLYLEVQGQEYDVTPGDWKQSGPCPVLKEYEARLRVNASEADAFQKKLIAESDPQLRLDWRLDLSYPIRRYILSFEAESLWRRIETASRLGGRRKIGSSSVALVAREALQEAVKKSNLSLPKQWQERVNPVIAQVVQTFFELSEPTNLRDCAPIGAAEKCALLNESWKTEFPNRTAFTLEWQELQTVPTSEHASSWAPFKKSLK